MMQQTYRQPRKSAIFWSWFLLIATCVISIVPVIGFVSWLVAVATIVIVTILAIVIIGEGWTTHGVLILLAAYLFVPVIVLVAPIASSAMFVSKLEENATTPALINTDVEVDPRIQNAEATE